MAKFIDPDKQRSIREAERKHNNQRLRWEVFRIPITIEPKEAPSEDPAIGPDNPPGRVPP